MNQDAKSLMVLGTASHAGKSVVAAGLCRLLNRKGISVAPFKAQNMALNSFVTTDGGEMGRAQVVQADAAGVAPRVEMNPILLKPEGRNRIQVVLRGKVYASMTAQEYYARKPFFLEEVLRCHGELARTYDVIVVEGAGSPVEMNLLDRDIVNLPLARAIDAQCLLVADIDRGGIFASLVGTRELCTAEDRLRIRGFLVNKFRGEESLFADGVEMLEKRTGWPCLGVLPYAEWLTLEEEDSVALEEKTGSAGFSAPLTVAVVSLPHMSNYTDFDPIEQSNARLVYARHPEQLAQANLVILPGSKNTIGDLLWLRHNGWFETLRNLPSDKVTLLGVCGGFQMLGERVRDPHGVESGGGAVEGLGLLPCETVLTKEKTTQQVEAVHEDSGENITGYEIHMGETRARTELPPFSRIRPRNERATERTDGYCEGAVFGTYLHGLFDNEGFTRKFLAVAARRRGKTFHYVPGVSQEAIHDRWADLLEEKLRLDLLEEILERPLANLAQPPAAK